jgi:predicted kinase
VDSPAYVVVSGLPGSGKSTLARGLAARLGLAVIDKDVVLEALYDSLGVGPEPWRHRLSRAADDVLYAQAALAPGAVLDNWWHPETAPARLHELCGQGGARLVQVHCDCDAAVAAARFQARARHPGHLDPVHTPEQVAERVAAARASYRGPLDLDAPLLRVETGGGAPVDAEMLAAQVGGLLTRRVPRGSPPTSCCPCRRPPG